MIGLAIKGVTDIASSWLEGRNAKIKAKAKAEAAVMVRAAESQADWEKIMAVNSGQSLKDEWLTLLFSLPLILCFFPSMVQYVEGGFEALEKMPEWYQYTLSIIVAASFGVRSAIGFKKLKR